MRFRSLAIPAFAFCLLNLVNAQMQTNGSFETSDFAGWVATGQVVAVQSAPYGGVPVPKGAWFAAFNGGQQTANGRITQKIRTVAGEQYRVSFQFGNYGFRNADGSSKVQKLTVVATDVVTGSTLANPPTYSDNTSINQNDEGKGAALFSRYSFTFRAVGDESLVSFSDVGSETLATDGVLDSVVIGPVKAPKGTFSVQSGVSPQRLSGDGNTFVVVLPAVMNKDGSILRRAEARKWKDGALLSVPPSDIGPTVDFGIAGVSKDASFMVGAGGQGLWKWGPSGCADFGPYIFGGYDPYASGMSLDGSTVTGGAAGYWTGAVQGWWSRDGDDRILPYYSATTGVSEDGASTVGWVRTQTGDLQSFFWLPLENRFAVLGTLNGNSGFSIASATTNSLNFIVGQTDSPLGVRVAYRWTATSGMRQLESLSAGGWANAWCQTWNGNLIGGGALDSSTGRGIGVVWDEDGKVQTLRSFLTSYGINVPVNLNLSISSIKLTGRQLSLAGGCDTGSPTSAGSWFAKIQWVATPPRQIFPADQVILTDTRGKTVKGILCDNFRSTPQGDLDVLRISTDGSVGAISAIEPYMCDATGKQVPVPAGSSDGTVTATGSDITFVPPLEFNRFQQPSSTGGLSQSRGSTRDVYVAFKFTGDGGVLYQTEPVKVILARPPVVFVHGINDSPAGWRVFVESMYTTLGGRVPFVAYGHGQEDPHVKGRDAVEAAAAGLAARIRDVLISVRAGKGWLPTGTDGEGVWDDFVSYPNNTFVDRIPLAAKRGDLVAHSYGGVICRWYLADRTNADGTNIESRNWYYPSTYGVYRNNTQTILPWVPPYRGDVRKLITLGSMWRGVPLCNADVEVVATEGSESAFGSAPVSIQGAPVTTLKAFFEWLPNPGGGKVVEDIYLPTWQVMAVNSPWLTRMVVEQTPCVPTVGYSSVAGDTPYGYNGFFTYVNVYGVFDAIQRPSWFPYMSLNNLLNATKFDYADGVVPVWSACLPGIPGRASLIIGADHSALPSAPDAIGHTLRWLNNANIPGGSEINSAWSDPNQSKISSRGANPNTWLFASGSAMAPIPQNDLYSLGRITSSALREGSSWKVTTLATDHVDLSFHSSCEISQLVVRVLDMNDVRVAGATVKQTMASGVHNLSVPLRGLHTGISYQVEISWQGKVGIPAVILACDPKIAVCK